jgi:hypothetical protein
MSPLDQGNERSGDLWPSHGDDPDVRQVDATRRQPLRELLLSEEFSEHVSKGGLVGARNPASQKIDLDACRGQRSGGLVKVQLSPTS